MRESHEELQCNAAGWVMTARMRSVAIAGLIGMGAVALAVAIAVCAVSFHITRSASPHLYEDLASLPHRDVGLVLGTSRFSTDGLNEFYTARIEAAAALYHDRKINHIIVSGSNPSRYYNEPVVMKRDLVELDVPETCITEDRGGLRTLDSIVRADRVMGQKSFTVVSQRFHAERAVYIGRHFGLDVTAFCAKDPVGLSHYGAYLREYGARFKAMLDLTVLDTQPTYLGKPIEIRLQPHRDQVLRTD